MESFWPFILCLCSAGLFVETVVGRPAVDQIDVKLPFNLQSLPINSGPNRRSRKGKGRAEVNMPFSDMKLPLLDQVMARMKDRPRGIPSSQNRPFMQFNDGRTKGRRAKSRAGKEQPVSVMNMPFSQFNLPLSHVSEEKQKVPLQVEAQRRAKQQGLDKKSGARTPFFQGGAEKGNLASAGQMSMSTVDSKLLPIPNKMSMPLSILNFPHNLIDLPLSKILMPFSNVNNMPGAPVLGTPGFGSSQFGGQGMFGGGGLGAFREIISSGTSADPEVLAANRNEEGLSSLVAEAAAALQPPLAVNLNGLSMPYSFMNQPLGFFNLPLSFLNLPYASTNLPFAHLNLPFGFTNLPFFEMIQSFGPGTVRNVPTTAQVGPDEPSPLDDPYYFVSDAEELPPPPVDLKRAQKQEQALEFIQEMGEVALGKKKLDPIEAIEKPRDAMRFTDGLVKAFATHEKQEYSNPEVTDEMMADFNAAFRSAVPGIPDLAGLLGAPNSLFVTPFSLFNLPLGFMDMPMGFHNMPFSHFNLPLSHLSLPFASLALPVDDIATPELEQTVETASVELADIPPSLLEILNPENKLQSYMNLPLSEMNMPIAVLEMPFAVFDMPFAFLNLPVGHLNNPFTHLHLPFEISTLPLAELSLPFESLIPY